MKYPSKEQLTNDIGNSLIGTPFELRQFSEWYDEHENIQPKIPPKWVQGDGYKNLKSLFEDNYGWNKNDYSYTIENYLLTIKTPYYCELLVFDLRQMAS